MKITIKTLNGQTFPLEVEPQETVLQIKEKIHQVKQFEVALQKLLRKGTILQDETTVQDAGIQEGEFLVVMVQVKKPVQNPPPVQQPQQVNPQPVQNPPPQQPIVAPNVAPQPANQSGILQGQAYEAAINEMISMGFARDQCVASMKAAFNNPERAIEYLLNGNIPQVPQAPLVQPAPQAVQPPAGGGLGAGGLGAGGLGAGGLGGAGGQQFAQIRQLFQQNPQAVMQHLPQILQQIAQTNPQLAQVIQQNPQALLQLLMGDGGPPPVPQTQIQLSPNEVLELEQIMAMGFSKTDSLEAYLACDKNVETALNYLFERQARGELLTQHITNEQNNPDNHGDPDVDPELDEGPDDDDIYQ